MPSQKTQLINNEIYHVILRAVGDTVIFHNEDDYYRGIFSIYEFNNLKLITIRRRRAERKREKVIVSDLENLRAENERELLVDIFGFCFMPNHIHLLLRQKQDAGITNFMRKVGGGYANYFNKKYDRKGHLFNQFKAVHIKGDNQLKVVINYIHCNAVSLLEPGWKEKGVKNSQKVNEFLEKYRWSSYQDYIGVKNFPSVTFRDFILQILNNKYDTKSMAQDWVKHKESLRKLGYLG